MSERVASYLDYNATAPVRPEVASAMASALAACGNPSSVHEAGRRAKSEIETAREAVANLVGAHPGSVVFTSGGTEANNIALRGAMAEGRWLIASAVEHDSVLNVLSNASGHSSLLPVDGDGIVELDLLAELLVKSAQPALISVMLANNETGVIQPVSKVVEIARAHGARVHCDAVQGPGKIAVDFDSLGVDLMTISAHKFGGPQGVGAIAVRDGVELEALLYGGSQERGRRAGTENVSGIIGFGTAAMVTLAAGSRLKQIESLRDRLEGEVSALAAELTIVGAGVPRLPNTSCIVMPGVPSEAQVMALDLAGVAVSAGSACSSGKVTRSHVLEAMGLSEKDSGSAIRVSLGWASEMADVERFVEAWQALYDRLGRKGTARPAA